MKNYRKLVPIAVVVVMALSWYMLISNKLSVDREYNKYLTEARNYADINVTKYASELLGYCSMNFSHHASQASLLFSCLE